MAAADVATWPARLQERLAAAERAVAALLAVCEEPGVRAAMEVRARLLRSAHKLRARQRMPAARAWVPDVATSVVAADAGASGTHAGA